MNNKSMLDYVKYISGLYKVSEEKLMEWLKQEYGIIGTDYVTFEGRLAVSKVLKKNNIVL